MPSRPSFRSVRRAMTLVEVMISFAVFTLIALATYSSFTFAAKQNRAAIAATTASNLAAAICNQFRDIPYGDLEKLLADLPPERRETPKLLYFNKTYGTWSPMVWYDNNRRLRPSTAPIPVSVIQPDGKTRPAAPVYITVDSETVLRNRTYTTTGGTRTSLATLTPFVKTGSAQARLAVRVSFVQGKDLPIPDWNGGALLTLKAAAGSAKYARIDVAVTIPDGVGGAVPPPVCATAILSPSFQGGSGINNS